MTRDWGLGTKRLGDWETSAPLSFIPPMPYPPLRGTFPSRGRMTIRAYRPLTCSEAATLRAVPFPRIVIPSEVEGSLLHCRNMHACALTQTTPWCFPLFSLTHVLPVCKKDFSASALMTRKKDDASHRLSYRCVELCLSEALYPAPSARPFSKGLLVSSE